MTGTRKPVILVLLGAFWPGHEASGPNLSLKALCEALAEDFEFRLIARDRPFDGDAPLALAGRWHDLGFARALYLEIGPRSARDLAATIRATPHDVLMLNGFFDREFTIPALVARRIGGIPRGPLILSPRGEFSGGALALKGLRKRVYRGLARALDLLRDVQLHATSEAEEGDLRAAFPNLKLRRVANARATFPLPPHEPRAAGAPLRAVFLGRISPVKGLHVALDALARTTQPVHLDIFGPASDAHYRAQCGLAAEALPDHVSVSFRGEIGNEAVGAELARHDLLLLPSRSENFGHAIFEALAAGTPVLIGDATPWRGLAAKKAGRDMPLGDRASLGAAIDGFAAMDAKESAKWRRGARRTAEAFARGNAAPGEMRAWLMDLIAARVPEGSAR